ncbi:MAG: sigma 54-interacting transcriptional regulator, partial [Pseudomonadota bacterium]
GLDLPADQAKGSTMKEKTVLLAEDDASIRLVVSQTLVSAGYQVRATASPDALERWVRSGDGDVVVTDVFLSDTEIFDRLPSLKLARPEMPFIVMSAQNTILTAATAAEQGAFEYLPKPFDIDNLVDTVRRALKTPKSSDALAPDMRRVVDEAALPLIGRSDAMQDVYRVLTRVMNTDLTVLIEGEAGTGKSLAARAIHDLGKGSEGGFHVLSRTSVAAGAPAAELLEGAATLYVDEVSDFSLDEQAGLLECLDAHPHVRVIASSRRPLQGCVEADTFRNDLFYRLAVVRFQMPPLRERKTDIPELARSLLLKATQRGLPSKALEPGAIDLLTAYDWPGNVRELESVIARLCALAPAATISAQDVEREVRAGLSKTGEGGEGFEAEVEALLRRHVMSALMRAGDDDAGRVYQDVIEKVERPLISLALQVTSGNKVRAASLLGVNRNTLRAKINGLGIAND